MDFSALTAARDKLNADINTLISANKADQTTIDKITADAAAVDTEIQAVINPAPGPLDFTAFDAAVTAFKADPKLVQKDIDVATGAIQAATV